MNADNNDEVDAATRLARLVGTASPAERAAAIRQRLFRRPAEKEQNNATTS